MKKYTVKKGFEVPEAVQIGLDCMNSINTYDFILHTENKEVLKTYKKMVKNEYSKKIDS